ncbi:MAG: thioredoxin domain-containing protein [Gammaproteobacteria bacterium]|nr:thioredoxin domain-containing protein [Gammaproteobacteria bacterium]
MSRKSKRNQPTPDSQNPHSSDSRQPSGSGRRGILIGLAAMLLVAVAMATLVYRGGGNSSSDAGATARSAALTSAHSPTLGPADAKVHIVEFLDPACETCAQFFPTVKQWLAENPDKIRLSVRHIAFHSGSDYVVRVLEASRKQDQYWQTLEAVLASQAQWAPNHTAQPELVMQAIAGLGLNREQLLADMNASEVTQRMEQDRNDAIAMKVTATPEYFVNGRPLPSFGEQQLLNLVNEELQRAD